jgi:hypothetical protein
MRRYQKFSLVVVPFAMVEQDVCKVWGGEAPVIVSRFNLDLGWEMLLLISGKVVGRDGRVATQRHKQHENPL